MSSKKQPVGKVGASSRPWGLLGVLVAVSVVAYWNSFDVPLVFDDLLSIQRNPSVRFGEFSWYIAARFILYLTFTLNYIWAGQAVWSYHLVNLCLHIGNGILLFFIAEHIFRRVDIDVWRARIFALMASSFFLVHPIQTESVTYISSRSELLSTAFYLIGFLLFVKWPERRIGFLFSLLIALPFFLGLGTKETVISLPATIFLYDFLFLSHGELRPMFGRWRFYVTFALGGVGAAYYILTVALKGSVGANLVGHLTSAQYFLTQLRVIVRYIYLIFLPIGQNLDYDIRPSYSPFEPAVIASGLFLLCILVVGWIVRKRQPIVSFSIFWFFLALAPTSSVVPILDVIFEHRLYLPMVGVALSFPFLLEMLRNQAKNRLDWKISTGSIACVLLGTLTVATILRNQVWRDEVRLWEDVISKSPHKDRAYNGLVYAHFKKGEFQPAIDVISTGLKEIPEKRLDLTEQLGNLYLKTGRFDDAITAFKETLVLKEPRRQAMAYNNLGVSYLYKWQSLYSSPKLGEPHPLPGVVQRRSGPTPTQVDVFNDVESILRPAAAAFSRSVEIDPTLHWAVDSLVNISYDIGESGPLEARALNELKVKDDFNSLYTVGKIAFLAGDFTRADQFFERAEKLKDDDKTVYFNHAYALRALGNIDAAIAKYLQAIRADPIFVEAHFNVAQLYMSQGNYPQAIDHFSEMLRFDPTHEGSNLNLAQIYFNQGNKEAARQRLNAILSSSPGNQKALDLWQKLGL